MDMTRVLITRPSPEAERWVDQLCAQQIQAEALPLLRIAPVDQPELVAALRHAQTQWRSYRALMFVSANAASEFLTHGIDLPASESEWLPDSSALPRFWSPGPGTARALMQAGVPATQIDGPAADAEQFDSESLWLEVETHIQSGDRVLVVRGASSNGSNGANGSTANTKGGKGAKGGNGRDWLATQITAAGGQVEFVAAYQRLGAQLDSAGKDLARRAASDGTVWFFSSSEAIQNLRLQMPQTSWHKARALVTHPRIADTARAAGFGDVSECRPTLQEVAASIKSMI